MLINEIGSNGYYVITLTYYKNFKKIILTMCIVQMNFK